MTNKTTMPEPVSRVVLRGDGPHLVYDHQIFSTDKRLITTAQAEAYKDACVRQALEAAAQECEARIGTGDAGIDTSDCDEEAQECAAAIRALIPK